MLNILVLIFLVGVPAISFVLISYAKRLLIDTIPKFDADMTKTRTDMYSMRAAYATFMVGLILLIAWGVGVTVIGCTASVKAIW